MNPELAAQIREVGNLLENRTFVGDYAVDNHGNFVNPCDVRACRWCLIGAICKVVDYRANGELVNLYEFNELGKAVKQHLGVYNIQSAWEGPGTSWETRRELAQRLQKVGLSD